MARERNGKRGIAWAWIGAVILAAGIIAIIFGALLNQQTPIPSPSASPEPPDSPSALPTVVPGAVVDPSVTDKGWVPEPITTDANFYIQRALEAASTFDTQLSSREEWLAYLETWFTPDTRYTSEPDRDSALDAALLELRQSVVLTEADWDSLASAKGRVVAALTGAIEDVAVSEDPSGDMRIGTADVALSYTRVDGDGAEYGYEDRVRVSVQVLCGEGSVPAPGSAQQSGDCKVVRFFAEPMEP
ncbi:MULTISPECIES: hypothetical protein [unclassified Microbacterium]|uniref:hypothetical protein n=1 Tax=unclassified Microbacterium TaxID=2609290 RepID=UPI0031388A6F